MNNIATESKRVNNAKTKREKLFSHYAQNLSIYFPSIRDKFMCPVCKELYSREDLMSDPPRISLAHIIPKSVGGKKLTLACGACDNRIGSEYDKHRYFESKSKERREKNIGEYGHILIGNKMTGAILHGSLFGYNDDAGLIVKPPVGIPLDYWQKRIKEMILGNKFTIKFKMEDFNLQRRNISCIYSAFLMMFSKFGYEYILSPNVDIIRQTLMGEPNSFNINSIISNLPVELIPEPSPFICVLNEPKEFRSFLVALPSLNGGRAVCVFLPGFGGDGKSSYDNLQNVAKTQDELKGNFKIIPRDSSWPNLFDINHKGFGNWMWNQLDEPSR